MISVWMVISIFHCRAARIHARSEACARGSIPWQFAEGNAVATLAKAIETIASRHWSNLAMCRYSIHAIVAAHSGRNYCYIAEHAGDPRFSLSESSTFAYAKLLYLIVCDEPGSGLS